MGDKLRAGRDVYQAKNHSVLTVGSPAANAADIFAALSDDEQAEVVRQAGKQGGNSYSFALSLFKGSSIDAPFEAVNHVLAIIENVSSHFSR